MKKAFYTDYARHCLRFYARAGQPKFKSETDRLNWTACFVVLNRYEDWLKEILLAIYRERDTVPDNVYQASIRYKIPQNKIWKEMEILERRIAKRRGLL